MKEYNLKLISNFKNGGFLALDKIYDKYPDMVLNGLSANVIPGTLLTKTGYEEIIDVNIMVEESKSVRLALDVNNVTLTVRKESRVEDGTLFTVGFELDEVISYDDDEEENDSINLTPVLPDPIKSLFDDIDCKKMMDTIKSIGKPLDSKEVPERDIRDARNIVVCNATDLFKKMQDGQVPDIEELFKNIKKDNK